MSKTESPPPPKAQLDEYIRRLEETERSLRTAEAKIAERDERIKELERLLDCMGKVKGAPVGTEDVWAGWENKCQSTNTRRCLFSPGKRSTPEEAAGKRAAPALVGADGHDGWHCGKKVERQSVLKRESSPRSARQRCRVHPCS